ncbi:hypothetical protein [Micromonospora chersina]|uniref:hypothetical protein n=1 Tax=Micromonospora chersina TaxID=47854 RepID=UPI003719B939
MGQVRTGASLRDIKDQLGAVIEESDTANFSANVSVLRSLAVASGLAGMIEQVIDDDDRLAEIAARSYFHANNVLELVLMSGDTNPWKLRLHVWHPQPDVTEEITEDVRSHRWDFTTALLAGEHCAREFRVGEGDEYHHLKYLPVGADNSFTLESQGRLSSSSTSSRPCSPPGPSTTSTTRSCTASRARAASPRRR